MYEARIKDDQRYECECSSSHGGGVTRCKDLGNGRKEKTILTDNREEKGTVSECVKRQIDIIRDGIFRIGHGEKERRTFALAELHPGRKGKVVNIISFNMQHEDICSDDESISTGQRAGNLNFFVDDLPRKETAEALEV